MTSPDELRAVHAALAARRDSLRTAQRVAANPEAARKLMCDGTVDQILAWHADVMRFDRAMEILKWKMAAIQQELRKARVA